MLLRIMQAFVTLGACKLIRWFRPDF